jgi:hypothetical protein
MFDSVSIYDGLHKDFGYGSRNQEGEGVSNFTSYNLMVVNTLFRKIKSHLVTFNSG